MYQVLKIFGFATLVASTLSAPSKSVNVELETSVLFEPEDTEKHLKLIHHVRDVLDKLENAIHPKFRHRSLSHHEPTQKTYKQESTYQRTQKTYKQESTHEPIQKTYKQETIENSANTKILTNIVNDLLRTISKYHEVDIQIFVTNLESEMRTHFYKGSVFREMVYDPELQSYIRRKLKQWASTDAGVIKDRLLTHLNTSKNNDTVLNTIGRLNAFYDSKNEVKLRAIFDKLTKPRRHLPNIIKEALDYLIFEHYDKMNHTLRAKFADEVNKLAGLVRKTNKKFHKDFNVIFRSSGGGETKKAMNGVEDEFKTKGNYIDDDQIIENGNAKYIDREMDYNVELPNARRYNDEGNIEENIESDKDKLLMKTERLIQDMVDSVSKKVGQVSVDKENREAPNGTIIIASKGKNEDEIVKETKDISLSKERDKYDTHDTIANENEEKYINQEVIRNVSKEKDDDAVNKDIIDRNENTINKESKDKDTIDKENKERYDIFKESIKKYEDAISKGSSERDEASRNKDSNEKDKYSITEESEEKYGQRRNGLSIPLGTY